MDLPPRDFRALRATDLFRDPRLVHIMAEAPPALRFPIAVTAEIGFVANRRDSVRRTTLLAAAPAARRAAPIDVMVGEVADEIATLVVAAAQLDAPRTRADCIALVLSDLSTTFVPSMWDVGDLEPLTYARMRSKWAPFAARRAEARTQLAKEAATHMRAARREAFRKRRVKEAAERARLGREAFEQRKERHVAERLDKVRADLPAVGTAKLADAVAWWRREGSARYGTPFVEDASLWREMAPLPWRTAWGPWLRHALGMVHPSVERVEVPHREGRDTGLAPISLAAVVCDAANRLRDLPLARLELHVTVALDEVAGDYVRQAIFPLFPDAPPTGVTVRGAERVRDGATLRDIVAVSTIGGRVFALQRPSPQALPLPRPYDEFDGSLRNGSPPLVHVHRGFDVTSCMHSATLTVTAANTLRTLVIHFARAEDDTLEDATMIVHHLARLAKELSGTVTDSERLFDENTTRSHETELRRRAAKRDGEQRANGPAGADDADSEASEEPAHAAGDAHAVREAVGVSA